MSMYALWEDRANQICGSYAFGVISKRIALEKLRRIGVDDAEEWLAVAVEATNGFQQKD